MKTCQSWDEFTCIIFSQKHCSKTLAVKSACQNLNTVHSKAASLPNTNHTSNQNYNEILFQVPCKITKFKQMLTLPNSQHHGEWREVKAFALKLRPSIMYTLSTTIKYSSVSFSQSLENKTQSERFKFEKWKLKCIMNLNI